MRRFLIRADGGHRLGMGHIVKSMHLAQELSRRGHEVRFLTKEEPTVLAKLRGAGFETSVIPRDCDLSPELERVNRELTRSEPDVLVTDIWRLPKEYFAGVRKAGALWAAIDLLDFEQSVVDVAFNGIASELKSDMTLKGATRLYRGPAYAMLDPRCRSLRDETRIYPETARSLVLSFGGSDPLDLTSRTLEAFADKPHGFHLSAVLGPAYARKEKVGETAGLSDGAVTLLEDLDFLPGLYSRSDLAVTAGGGGTLYELAVTGTPAIVLAQVPHQAENAKRFEEEGVVRFAGNGWRMDPGTLLQAVWELARDREVRTEMGRRGKALVDGDGVTRIADILEGKPV